MGQVLSRFNFVITVVRELGGEYSTVQKRVNLSPGLPVNDPTLPYWTVPPIKLPGRNNTRLPSHTDVLIIGSGITGVSCARTLLKKGPPGLRVLVLEARDVCSGATGRNGGHLNPPLFHDYVQLKSDYGIESAKRIIRFRRAHISALREAVGEIGALDHSQIRDVEMLDVYFDHDTFKKEAQALEVWRKDMPEEAADSRVIEGHEAAKMFRLSDQVVAVIVSSAGAVHPYRAVTSIFANLLNQYPDQLDLFTQTPCTGITPPSTVTPHYTIQTPRGTTTASHIIHATNGWTSHLLPGMRGKVIPQRGTMTAQRPGTGLPTDTCGNRAHIFNYPAPGYDYLTQLPRREGKGGELLFGGGFRQAERFVISEFGVADDSGYHLGIASHLEGALPEYFGRRNWGAESVDAAREVEEENSPWGNGRVKAVWTGILCISTDLRPWVGRVPSVISDRAAPQPLLTTASDIAVVRSLAAPGEWVSTGYGGEGMVHAWLCAHALALMVLGLENEEDVHTWFPDEYRLTEKRWKKATIEQLMAKY